MRQIGTIGTILVPPYLPTFATYGTGMYGTGMYGTPYLVTIM